MTLPTRTRPRRLLFLAAVIVVTPVLAERVSLDPRSWVAPALACSCNWYPPQKITPEIVPRNFVASGWVDGYGRYLSVKKNGAQAVPNSEVPLELWDVTHNKKIEATRRDVSGGTMQRAELTPKSPLEAGILVELRAAIDAPNLVPLSKYKTSDVLDTSAPTIPDPKMVRYMSVGGSGNCWSGNATIELVFDSVTDDQSTLDQMKTYIWASPVDALPDESKPQEWAGFYVRQPGEVVTTLGSGNVCAPSTFTLPSQGAAPIKIQFEVVDAARNRSRAFSLVVNDQGIVSTSWGGTIIKEPSNTFPSPQPSVPLPPQATRSGCASIFLFSE